MNSRMPVMAKLHLQGQSGNGIAGLAHLLKVERKEFSRARDGFKICSKIKNSKKSKKEEEAEMPSELAPDQFKGPPGPPPGPIPDPTRRGWEGCNGK